MICRQMGNKQNYSEISQSSVSKQQKIVSTLSKVVKLLTIAKAMLFENEYTDFLIFNFHNEVLTCLPPGRCI